ncbi:MAG TPA: outer membrane beta-barrel protein [Thermoanaerobaculia bacterium]|nr:outer membrane beta-barrel protein [Thermoanaerobaculia bacterium]
MERRILLLFSLIILLTVTSLSAADNTDTRWRVSILASEISNSGNQPWSDDPHAGIGIGVAYAPAPQWDMELTVSSQSHRSPYNRLFYFPGPNGAPGLTAPVFEIREYSVRPVDLSLTRHFLTDQPIAPYVRAGVRYVDAPNDIGAQSFVVGYNPGGELVPPFVQFSEGFGFRDRVSAQAGAGFRVRVTPRTSLRVEASRLIRSDKADFDPLIRYAAGVSWLF